MNSTEIEKFLNTKTTAENCYVKINFRKREPVYGLFLKEADYNDLKSKNFWRIVTRKHFDQWSTSKDVSLARIFSGSDFSKLTPYTDTFEE